MNRLLALLSLAFISTASQALTLEPLPGSSPQETCISCVFPNPVGVIVRGDSGQPLAGVEVTFYTPGTPLGMVRYDDFCCQAFETVVVTSDAQGVAVGTTVALEEPNASGVVTASAAGAADVYFPLSSTAQHVSAIEVIAGDEQYVEAGKPFAPWKVLVTDQLGNPMARAVVTFEAPSDAGGPSATFSGGGEWALAVTDANGIATAPPALAGSVGGVGNVFVVTKNSYQGDHVHAYPIFYNVLAGPVTTLRATLVTRPEDSMPTNWYWQEPVPSFFVVKLVDSRGRPAANNPVVFKHFNECTGFDGDPNPLVVMSDANGKATSPRLQSFQATGICRVEIFVPGPNTTIPFNVHVYEPTNVVVKARNDVVISKTRKVYSVYLEFKVNGLPVRVWDLEAVNLIRAPFLPPAGFEYTQAVDIKKGSATLNVLANRVPGLYDLDIVYLSPSSRTRVHVIQRP